MSTPAMIRSRLLLPAPFAPSTPIFAPGRKYRVISSRITRSGGTTLRTSRIVKTNSGATRTFLIFGEREDCNASEARSEPKASGGGGAGYARAVPARLRPRRKTRKAQREGRALARPRAQIEQAAVIARDVEGDREAEAGPLVGTLVVKKGSKIRSCSSRRNRRGRCRVTSITA